MPISHQVQQELCQMDLSTPHLASASAPQDQKDTQSSSPSCSSDYGQFPSRKPISMKWTCQEHARFLEAMEMFPSGPWKRIAQHVGTKNARQTMSHAQKYRQKLARQKRKNAQIRFRQLLISYRIQNGRLTMPKILPRVAVSNPQPVKHPHPDTLADEEIDLDVLARTLQKPRGTSPNSPFRSFSANGSASISSRYNDYCTYGLNDVDVAMLTELFGMSAPVNASITGTASSSSHGFDTLAIQSPKNRVQNNSQI